MTRIRAQSVTRVKVQCVTRIGTQSVTGVGAQNVTWVGAQSVTRIRAQSKIWVQTQCMAGSRFLGSCVADIGAQLCLGSGFRLSELGITVCSADSSISPQLSGLWGVLSILPVPPAAEAPGPPALAWTLQHFEPAAGQHVRLALGSFLEGQDPWAPSSWDYLPEEMFCYVYYLSPPVTWTRT